MAAPYAGRRLFVAPGSHAEKEAARIKGTDPRGAALFAALARQPLALWVGDWSGPQPESVVDRAVSEAGDKLRVLVVYHIPQRDLGSHSAGGAASSADYRSWIASFAAGLRGRLAIVVLEPDATAMSERMSSSARASRLGLLAEAVDTLTAAGGRVYVDAGSSNWVPVARMAELLGRAGASRGAGFALNTSGTQHVDDEIAYGAQIRKVLGTGARFVVDSSRAGRGPYRPCPGEHDDIDWLNAPDRGCGARPTLTVGALRSRAGLDALLWLKEPGSSDGVREDGDLPAGRWSASVARGLAERAIPVLVSPS